MNKKLKTVLIILALIIILAIAFYLTLPLILSGVVKSLKPAEPDDALQASALTEAIPTPDAVPEKAEHVNTVNARIVAAGDVVLNQLINEESKSEGGYDFSPVFVEIKDIVEPADYAVCYLVTTFNSSESYSSFPKSVSPPQILSALSGCGFDLVSTANRHAMDSFYDGLIYTIDKIDEAGLAHVGTYRSQEERNANSGAFIKDINGINVGFTAYTTDSSDVPITGFEHALNICTTDYLSGSEKINYEQIKNDLSHIKESGAEYIAVMVSWGDDFSKEVSKLQRELADYLISQGADLIIGSGTKIPQLIEKRTVELEDGSKKQGIAVYSIGNLCYFEDGDLTDISSIVNIVVTKDTDSGQVWLSELSYTPIKMLSLSRYGISDQGWNHRIFDIEATVELYENNSSYGFMNEEIYSDFKSSLSKAIDAFGKNYYKNK